MKTAKDQPEHCLEGTTAPILCSAYVRGRELESDTWAAAVAGSGERKKRVQLWPIPMVTVARLKS